MKVSYEGIGQWAATFACGQVAEGEMVKISGNGAVSVCNAGDGFCGQVLSVGRDGGACAVALGGMVTAGYTGTSAPALGWTSLTADGNGGVQAVSGSAQTESEGAQTALTGRSYLVVDVDTSGKTVTFVL